MQRTPRCCVSRSAASGTIFHQSDTDLARATVGITPLLYQLSDSDDDGDISFTSEIESERNVSLSLAIFRTSFT